MKSFFLFAKILITGGIVLGLELASSRILTPFFGVSLYVWSSILAVTLIALAIGYKAGGVLAGRLGREATMLFYVTAGGLSALWLNICVWSYPFLFWPLSDVNLVVGSIAACLYVLFVPLVILSALNPMLVALLTGEEKDGDHGAGGVFFVSTIGSVLGIFVVSYGFLPYMTNYMTIVLLTLLLAGLSVFMLLKMGNTGHRLYRGALLLSVAAFVIAGLTFATGGLERFTQSVTFKGTTWRVVHQAPSFFGHIKIVDILDKQGKAVNRWFLTDGLAQNQFHGTIPSALYTYALERLSLAAAKAPQKALVLGVGAGVIPTTFAKAGIQVDAVDINPKIVEVARDYLGFDATHENIRIDIQDARTAVRRCAGANYDIVAVDLFRDDGMPEHLVTREFFADLKSCMKDDGVMVMNTFMDMREPQSEHALLKTIGTVFGPVLFVPRPPAEGGHFTAAYLLTRKNGPVGAFDVKMDGMPRIMARELTASLQGFKLVAPDDPMVADAPLLTDVSNQWKHLAYASELAYRQSAVSRMPWQILMN